MYYIMQKLRRFELHLFFQSLNYIAFLLCNQILSIILYMILQGVLRLIL